MSPRPYRMEARQAAAEETRARIIAAARGLLSARGGISAFTIDAVAREAGVARMTVYHQFSSKTGLIEAVFDSLAIVRSGVPRLIAALDLSDPEETLAEFVRVLAEVWQKDRLVIQRLQGLAALDPEFSRVWHTRENRRREGLRQIATRVAAAREREESFDVEAVTSALYAICSPEVFQALAGAQRTFEAVAAVVHQLARKALALEDGEPVRFEPIPNATRSRRRRRGSRR